ncbi:MAG: ATP-dependent RecD-like DNA helicase [bacterium]|nr:ATP-dependent RecD-like DNA helicase [bacterium]
MPLVEIKGQIERITYVNEENHYTVARLSIPGKRDVVTVVGNFPALYPGEMVKLLGEWINHPKFGPQFRVVKYETITPATAHGIEKYLGSGLIKGIGPMMARRIVAKFGAETLEIIEHQIGRLTEVSGIGSARLEMIRTAWAEQKEIRQVMIFLQDKGVSPTYAAKIYKQYGQESISVVKNNPYRLATDIFGIGFLTADRIAESVGIPKDSPLRAEAGILYVLNELADEGHVYYPYEPLIEKCAEMLNIDREGISRALASIALQNRIVIEDLNPDVETFRENNKAVYLTKFHTCEQGIAKRFHSLLRMPKYLRPIDLTKAILWVQDQLGITMAEKQIEAIRAAIEEKVMILTGGPGTGKTTIVKAIISLYEKLGRQVILTAPTGRAAKRLAETTGREAKTIHRLLEFQPTSGRFKKDDETPLKTDVLIVDEVSMIDTVLMYHLLKATPLSATLILVGDIHQLPSVGAGNVLKDLIASGRIKVVELNEIFRQARESLIVVNAHLINQGQMPKNGQSRAGKLLDFYFIQDEEPQDILTRILELVKERIPKRFGFDPISEVQVLTPMHKGILGAANLNAELQRELNSSQREVARGGRVFKLNDKVMQIRNNYDKEVFNGDIGRICGLDLENQQVRVNFDGREVAYDFLEVDELALAYAVSVHKAQGSEYPAIVMPIVTQHYMLLQRNLLYTAVTRARKLVVLIGTPKALAIAVKNNKVQRRYTRLAERISAIP